MKNNTIISRLIWEAKKKGKKVNPWAVCTSSIAKSTGKTDKRRRDNKETPKNTPELKPHKHKKGD